MCFHSTLMAYLVINVIFGVQGRLSEGLGETTAKIILRTSVEKIDIYALTETRLNSHLIIDIKRC